VLCSSAVIPSPFDTTIISFDLSYLGHLSGLFPRWHELSIAAITLASFARRVVFKLQWKGVAVST